VLQFVEPSPESKLDPCVDPEQRRRGECAEQADAVRTKSPDAHTIFVNGAIAACLALAAAAAVIWVPFLEPIRDRFANTQPGWVVASFVLQVLSVLSFVVALRGAFARRLDWRESFDVGVVEETANVFLPSGGSGGLALGAVILIRSGIPTAFAVSRSAVLFLVTSGVSLGALVVFGTAEAVGILPGDVSLAATLIPAAGAALVIAAAIALPHLPQIDPDSGGRIHHAIATLQLWLREAVGTSLELLASREVLLIAGAIGYYAFDVASMGAAFEALGGGGPELGLFVLAYTLGHGGAIIPIPGSAEGGLVGAFTLYGTALSLSAGGILLYRTFHAGVPFLFGALGLADIGRRGRRERRSGRERNSVSQASIAVSANTAPSAQTADQPPSVQASEPAAEPTAPPTKFEVT
jgi:uncharacterized membrane protein YbhN (UPF0104 family)